MRSLTDPGEGWLPTAAPRDEYTGAFVWARWEGPEAAPILVSEELIEEAYTYLPWEMAFLSYDDIRRAFVLQRAIN